MEDWIANNLRSLTLSPQPAGEVEHRTMWDFTPQPQHESFFEEAYESITLARGFSDIKEVSSSPGHAPAELDLQPAIITAPFLENSSLPPRSHLLFPLTNSSTPPTLHPETIQLLSHPKTYRNPLPTQPPTAPNPPGPSLPSATTPAAISTTTVP